MKLIMTLLVRDEVDIIRENIQFHLRMGVDFFIVTDNGSTDGTLEILEEFRAKGVLYLIQEPEDNYAQSEWVSRMARLAYSPYGADWVINNDADEFWWPATGDLKYELDRIPRDISVVSVTRHNFINVLERSGRWIEGMIFRETESKNSMGAPLPPKVCHRAFPNIKVSQGNHAVEFPTGLRLWQESSIEILHFPVRSYGQFANKIAKGGAAYARNSGPLTQGTTWRLLYEKWCAGQLFLYFKEEGWNADRIAEGIKVGAVIKDTRLKEFFQHRFFDVRVSQINRIESGTCTGMTSLINSSLERLDRRSTDSHPEEIFVVSCVRNEHLRLPNFLQHYRALGADRFFIVDNGSSDGTTDYLLGQNDVHVFYTGESYAQSFCGVHWLNTLLTAFAEDHWVLTVDADELFVYPHYEVTNLHMLARYLDSVGAQGVLTMLLDMYSDMPISATNYQPGDAMLNACPFFDGDSYREFCEEYGDIPVRGGPRVRLFQYRQTERSPFLGKRPFVKWRRGLAYIASTHLIDGVVAADVTGLLLHFKFLSDFFERVHAEVRRKEHWDGAAQYLGYQQALQKNPCLNLYYPGSIRFEGSRQLVELGLMKSTETYDAFVFPSEPG